MFQCGGLKNYERMMERAERTANRVNCETKEENLPRKYLSLGPTLI